MRAIWKGSISFGLVNIPIRDRPATLIAITNKVTYHPIQGYGEYFFPEWQVLIPPVDTLNSFKPKQSEPVVIITDSETDHKKLLPPGWTGTDEVAHLDRRRHTLPMRYGVYRYSP